MGSDEWKTNRFRQEVKNRIELVIKERKYGVNKTVDELEEHIFMKSSSKAIYLEYVFKLIRFLKENDKSNLNDFNQVIFNRQMQQQGRPRSGPQMNTGQPVVMSSVNAPQANTIQQTTMNQDTHMITVNQNQTPIIINQVQMIPNQNNPNVSNTTQPTIQMQIQTNSNQPMQSNQMMQQRVQMPQNRVMMNQMMATGVNQSIRPNQMMQPNAQIVHRLRASNPNMGHMQQQTSAGQQLQNQTPITGQIQNQSAIGSQMSNQQATGLSLHNQPMSQGPNSVQNVHGQFNNNTLSMSNNAMHNQSQNTSGSQTTPSPGSNVPSPSSSLMASPMNVPMGQRTPSSIQSVCSPNPTLNTPVMSASASPNVRSVQCDEQAYKDKLKQLSRYIEPLRVMLGRFENASDKIKESSKIKNLLEIISDSNRRCSLETLLKCEQVLEKMEFKFQGDLTSGMSAGSGSSNSVGVSAVASTNQQSQPIVSKEIDVDDICAPLLEAVRQNYNKPHYHHAIKRTIGPLLAAMKASVSESEMNDFVDECKSFAHTHPELDLEQEDESDIPDIIQGEMARLDKHFQVELDNIQFTGNKTLYLKCTLNSKYLPTVPPILLRVPHNYPQVSPTAIIEPDVYDVNPFLQNLHSKLKDQFDRLPPLSLISTYLYRWEGMVRQAYYDKYD